MFAENILFHVRAQQDEVSLNYELGATVLVSHAQQAPTKRGNAQGALHSECWRKQPSYFLKRECCFALT